MFEVISSKSVLESEGDSVRVGCPLSVLDNAVIVSHRHMKLLYAKKKNLVLGWVPRMSHLLPQKWRNTSLVLTCWNKNTFLSQPGASLSLGDVSCFMTTVLKNFSISQQLFSFTDLGFGLPWVVPVGSHLLDTAGRLSLGRDAWGTVPVHPHFPTPPPTSAFALHLGRWRPLCRVRQPTWRKWRLLLCVSVQHFVS